LIYIYLIGVPISLIGFPTYFYFHIDEAEKFKCFNYSDYHHKDYFLFDNIKELKEYYALNPNSCTQTYLNQENIRIKIKNGAINVRLLEEDIDTHFVKIEYREFLTLKEYYTLKCFVNKYAPEDFTF
jgi:hypothetical protein